MRLNFLLAILLLGFGHGELVAAGVGCPKGQYSVRSHPRRAYYKADGTYVSATQVSRSCREKRKGHDFWSQKLKEGHPRDWTKREVHKKWTAEERERMLEALSELPEILWPKSLEGIYRMFKSKDHPNPASHGGPFVVLYDTAFGENQRLARVLAHELAHQNYEELNLSEGSSYRSAAGWTSWMDKDRNVFWIPRSKGFVKEDGQSKPGEDYANNIEYFLFEPELLKRKTPRVYDWIKSRYGDKLKIRGVE
jgi:hypothetical protein